MAAKKRTQGIDGNEDLGSMVFSGLKDNGVDVHSIGGDEETPTDLRDFISTGSSLLDLAISNRPNGGIAIGRVTEITGQEQAGKSLICAHMIADIQKKGGLAVLIDTENAVNEEFFRTVGVDFEKLIYVLAHTVEDVFETIEKVLEIVRAKSGVEKRVLVVVDSIAQCSTRKELAGEYEKSGYGTDKPTVLNLAFRKIMPMIAHQKVALVITNQLRYKMNVQAFQDPFVAPGGKALPHVASTRIRLALAGAIKNKDKEHIGAKVSAKIVKNRLGPPNRSITFDVYYDRGVDDVSSWIGYLNSKGIITGGAGGNWAFKDKAGNTHKFTTGTWKDFTDSNPEVFAEIYDAICEAMIMQYNSDGLSTVDGTAQVDFGED